jgi:hypothetical protein
MPPGDFVAVLSGDLVKSRGLEGRRQEAMDGLAQAIETARNHLAPKQCRLLFSGFYRGDAFQCGLSDPGHSLWTAAFLRTELIKLRGSGLRVDARLGLGWGAATEWDESNISASDGEAFQLSGKALNSLISGKEKYRRFLMLSPWPRHNELFSVISAFLDAMIQRWTPEQAQAISLFLREKGQEEISRILRISQPAVQTRLQTAGHFALTEALDLFSQIIAGKIMEPGLDKPRL